MSQREENNLTSAGILFFIVIILVCLGVWKFGQTFDLNFETAVKQILGLIVYLIFIGGCFYFKVQTRSRFLTLKVLLPIFIMGFYFTLSPAITYRMQNDYLLVLHGGVYWWYAWYSKLAVIIITSIISWLGLEKY